jgi:glycosyltransferase involved in cell wall biosynthesis
MRKIAIIVQRYGLEVNGGAEYHCKILAEKLHPIFDVEILTSCAKDHFTWANEYPEGPTVINGIKVRRFSVPSLRNKRKVNSLLRTLNGKTFTDILLRFFGFNSLVNKRITNEKSLQLTGDEWSKEQGPYTPGLIAYLEDHKSDYEALIFFTYLYFPTFFGLRVAPDKSILIPTAHDEKAINLPIFKPFFKLPKAILFNTLSEKRLVNRLFNNEEIYSDIVGTGVDPIIHDSEVTSAKILKSNAEYLIYIGRIDPAKGCKLMIDCFLKYKTASSSGVRLVLVGSSSMKIVSHPDIIEMGFVSEEVKEALLSGAKALIMPSYFESLSLVTLESMLNGIPVIANESCEVLKDHIENSKAGFLFSDSESFNLAVDRVLNDDLTLLKKNAIRYVNENYNWGVVIDKVIKAINYVTK